MKKTVLGFVLVFGIMASMSSCSTTYKMIVDENVPADRSTTVTFHESVKVREHNNRNILDDLYGDKEAWGKAILTVPAGNNSFLFDMRFIASVGYAYRNVEITQEIKNLEIRYDLEPGKKYLITGISKRTKRNLLGIGNYDLYVGIFDVTGKETLLREWKVGEFVDPYMIGE